MSTARAWWTVSELAEHWRLSTDKVYQLLVSGALRGHKLGKSWRVAESDKLAYERGAAHSAEPIVVVELIRAGWRLSATKRTDKPQEDHDESEELDRDCIAVDDDDE